MKTCVQQMASGNEPIVKLDFIKVRIDKHISTSMLPTTCTMVNLANFTYFGMLETNTQDVIIRCHILVKGFKTKGGNTCYCI